MVEPLDPREGHAEVKNLLERIREHGTAGFDPLAASSVEEALGLLETAAAKLERARVEQARALAQRY